MVGKDEEDYQNYRYRVLFFLPHLRFLDTGPVSQKERKEALRIGKYIQSVHSFSSDDDDDTDNFESNTTDQSQSSDHSNSTGSASSSSENGTKAQHRQSVIRVGVTRYIYSSRASEGNRFIRNEDL